MKTTAKPQIQESLGKKKLIRYNLTICKLACITFHSLKTATILLQIQQLKTLKLIQIRSYLQEIFSLGVHLSFTQKSLLPRQLVSYIGGKVKTKQFI